jgi:hypothetical protein
MMFADSLIANGQEDYVKQYLWTGSNSYNGGAIKRDLDYIVSGYSSDTCDLWEEIRSSDLFWNRLTMKKAMGMGSSFASRMGDSSTSSTYKSAEQKINSTLYNAHWSGSYVYESTSRTKVTSFIVDDPQPYILSSVVQDTAVIVGFNSGYDEADRMYSPTSYEVAATVSSYNTLFCNEYKAFYSLSVNSCVDALPRRPSPRSILMIRLQVCLECCMVDTGETHTLGVTPGFSVPLLLASSSM